MYRVLLVDDEALIREGVSENVPWQELGYELAATCSNGIEALDYICKNRVDVVLTDICMPFLDGIGLSEKLYEEFGQIKIIILSGYDDFEYAQKAIKYQVEDYVLKPVTAKELGAILTRLHQKMDAERNNAKKLYQSKQLMKQEVLWNLLSATPTNQGVLKEWGVNTEASYFAVGIVQMDLYRELSKLGAEEKKESALMAFVVHNICSEIVTNYEVGICVQGKDHQIAILFWTNKPREFREKLHKIGEELITSIYGAMHIEVTVSLGGYVGKIKEAYQSYEGAKQVLAYRYILGTKRVIDGEKETPGEAFIEEKEFLNELYLAVKTGDLPHTEQILVQIVGAMKKHICSKEKVLLCVQQILEKISSLFGEGEEEVQAFQEEKEAMMNLVLQSRSIEEAAKWVEDYCKKAIDVIRNRKNMGGMKYAVKAMDFIEKNYGDNNLNLNIICNYLNISTSRFSSIFKSVTRETFMEALIRIRMEKAKELLETTDLKNYEIAEKIGFSDPHYFSVSFKKLTGLTPTQYAEERQVCDLLKMK